MKLDAGDQKTLARLNRPTRDFSLEHTIEGLKGMPGLIVQSVLVDGPVSNARGDPYQAWLAALSEIRPTQVQIHSTDRPVPDAGIERVPPFESRRIAKDIKERTGLRVDAYWVQN